MIWLAFLVGFLITGFLVAVAFFVAWAVNYAETTEDVGNDLANADDAYLSSMARGSLNSPVTDFIPFHGEESTK